jgi:hypothetical protein
MQPQLMEQSLDAIAAGGEALKQADAIVNAVVTEKQAAEALIPGLVDLLVQQHLLEDHDRVPAIQKLASHNGALEVMGRLVNTMAADKTAYANQLRAAGPGAPVTEKAAGAASPRTTKLAFVGSRAGLGEHRDSDRKFADAMLGR